MSVIGFDIGNVSCVTATIRRGAVHVLLNDESNSKTTPAVVSFGQKQRFLGSFATVNPKSTISQIKRLIGKLYKEVQEDLKLLPFATSEGPRGGILIELEYLKKKWTFTPVEILGMLFKHLKHITEKNLESAVVDCVIGIPVYFTDMQRCLYLDAALLSGLNPLRLLHDGTAIALGYGMYKTDFPNSGPTNVMFVDIGHCDTQVTIAAFEPGKMKILSHSFDESLGGRDFDEVLFKHFASQFHKKYKIDVYSDAHASLRLRESCEKLKKVLSTNAEARVNIESLIGDTSVRGLVTREEFEDLSSKLLERVIIPCSMAIKESGLSVDEIYTIELVGSGSRIPAITRYLTLFLGKKPMTTLNVSDCVARGCALRCATLNTTFVVRDYKIEDSYPYSIVVSPTPEVERTLFLKGSPFPNETILHHKTKIIPLYTQVAYRKEMNFPTGISHRIGQFGIDWDHPSDEIKLWEEFRVEHTMKLDENGIVKLCSATFGKDRGGFSKFIRGFKLSTTKNVDVSTTDDELNDAMEKEKVLAAQDMKVEEIKDLRNSLKSLVYDTRNKFSSTYWSHATDSEKEAIAKKLEETDYWLFEDNEDESEQDYTGRLKDIKKLLQPVDNRYNEEKAMAIATKPLQTCIAKHVSHAESFSDDKKVKVKNICTEADQWLINAVLQKHSSPMTLSNKINQAIETVERKCESIMRIKYTQETSNTAAIKGSIQ